MTPRCPTCPIIGDCIVERTGHTPYCTWAARGGALLARVRELSNEPAPRVDVIADLDRAYAQAGIIRAPGGCCGGTLS